MKSPTSPTLFLAIATGTGPDRRGFVTLPNEERDKAAARVFSGDLDSSAPRVHRRGAQGAVRLSGGGAALDVECVVDGGVDREDFLSGAWALEALHLALPSSGRLMRILGPIVLPPTALMAAVDPEIAGLSGAADAHWHCRGSAPLGFVA
jgi:hypothetical protein